MGALQPWHVLLLLALLAVVGLAVFGLYALVRSAMRK
jgi:thiol:disulfide interchange protein